METLKLENKIISEGYDIKLPASDVQLYFGNKHILKGCNVTFGKNRITALIGHSGCGKSTILRCFNRMHDLSPDAKVSGRFLLDNDVDIYGAAQSVTQIRKKIGMVFQTPNPFPKSIYDNLEYGLKINGIPRAQHGRIIESSLKESYIWDEVKDELKKPATKLSGCQ